MDYVIAIPSYKRYEVLKKETLKTLENLKADKNKIHIFVANEEEKEKYINSIGNEYKIIVGVKGISSQRKFYHNYFPEGTRIISLDDDIAELLELKENELIPTTMTLDDIAKIGFTTCEKEYSKLWGICPTMNYFFMKNELTIGLRFICANFMGSYAGDWIFTDENRRMTPTGEDHHSTLRAFTKYGSVVRLEWLCPKTKYFASGGIDASVVEEGLTRAERHSQELTWVQSQFPELSKLKTKEGYVKTLRLKSITYKKYSKKDIIKFTKENSNE